MKNPWKLRCTLYVLSFVCFATYVVQIYPYADAKQRKTNKWPKLIDRKKSSMDKYDAGVVLQFFPHSSFSPRKAGYIVAFPPGGKSTI
jgi:hypothetical protein